MASLLGASSFSLLCWSPRSTQSMLQFKRGWGGRVLVLPLKCLSTGPNKDADSDAETSLSPSPLPFSSLSSSNLTYKWCAGLGGIGFLETTYLSYLKFTNSDAFCPIGGGNCSDILNSDYAVVFGLPLPFIGMCVYGLVATLGLQLAGNKSPFGIDESIARLILLGTTTSLAAASACFLYILSTSFPGASCVYCLTSALLSFGLFSITLKDFGFQEIQKVVGLQLCIAGLVVAALSTSYRMSGPVVTSLAEIDLQPFTAEITTQSSPFAVSLARHLHSIGAKMYGAFWCSHCIEQKQMFGSEASKLLDYVECFPNGYRKGTKIFKACADAGIEGFPTWVINGQVLSGEQELSVLAQASGFNSNILSEPQ